MWSGAPRVGFYKYKQSFKKGLRTRGQSNNREIRGVTGESSLIACKLQRHTANNWSNPSAPVAGRENLPRLPFERNGIVATWKVLEHRRIEQLLWSRVIIAPDALARPVHLWSCKALAGKISSPCVGTA